MKPEQIMQLSESKHERGLHRTLTLVERSPKALNRKLSFAEAWQMLNSVPDLVELNPCRFASSGYQNELLG